MYAVLVKNNETSWDVIHTLEYTTGTEKKTVVDEALAKDVPVVGMETTSYGNLLKQGSVWDGSSFSGGIELSPDKDPLDIWETHKRFSFLSENVVVANFAIENTSAVSDFLSAAFENEVILVTVPSDQSVSTGGTYGWDGSRFSAA
jgi:hypothetical protein